MKIVRYESFAGREYRIYPFHEPDATVDQLGFSGYLFIRSSEPGDLNLGQNLHYTHASLLGAQDMANAWQMLYKIGMELNSDYDAEIAVDEVITVEAQS